MSIENKLDDLFSDNEKIDLQLSYTRVSDFDRNGPQALLRRSFVENEGIKHGSLVDDILTDRMTNSTLFNDKYALFNGNKPSAMLGQLADIIIENYDSVPDSQTVLKIVKNNAFWSNVKDETKLIANFDKDEFWDYVTTKLSIKDKLVVTTSEYASAELAVDTLLTHEHSKDIFTNDLENHYQVYFENKYMYFVFRGYIDKLIIDHENKTVQFYDLKTGAGKGESFMKSFIDYRYYYQGAVYMLAFDSVCEQFGLKDYTLLPFKYLYLGKSENIPFIFTLTDKWYDAAVNGFKTRSGFKYTGLNENIEKIYFHWKTNQYDYAQEIYENKGKLDLNDDFIDVNE